MRRARPVRRHPDLSRWNAEEVTAVATTLGWKTTPKPSVNSYSPCNKPVWRRDPSSPVNFVPELPTFTAAGLSGSTG
jgi:hypothetical protein